MQANRRVFPWVRVKMLLGAVAWLIPGRSPCHCPLIGVAVAPSGVFPQGSYDIIFFDCGVTESNADVSATVLQPE